MPKLDKIIARFGLRVVLPAVIVLVGALAIVIISLSEMANEVNRIEDRLTTRSAEAAVQVVLRRIGETHHDYAVWDDAVRGLYGKVDQAFVDTGYVSSTTEALFFDTFFLLDESGDPVLGYHDGKRLHESPMEIYGPQLAQMVASLPHDGTTYAVKSGILKTKWGPTTVAVGPIVAFSEDYQPQPTAARLLVISQAFDQKTVAKLGTDFQIDGLGLVDAASAGPRSVPITDPAGQPVGALTWVARGLGNEAQARVSPTVFVMLALVCATMVFLLVIARRSIGEIRRRESEARHTATHDELTSLPNRAAAVAAIDKAIARREHGVKIAVIYVDLDRFKEVDEAYGHDAGDLLLRKIAVLFEQCANGHMLAKVGGDEFVFMVEDRKATKVACDIAWKLIESLADPFDLEGRVIPISASIGIAVADTIDPSAEELLRRADVAMYEAKQQGSNRFFVYEPLVDTVRHERIETADDLRRALHGGEGLSLAYQPIFDADTRVVVGVEALLRWDRPLFGPVPPEVFVPIAEEAGLIEELSKWTLRRACAAAGDWAGIRLSVNVSPVQFRNPNFDQEVTTILRETGFSAERLEFEIIESDILIRPDQARRTMEAIHGQGISITLDDFGSGYSSIGYLRSYAFDKIKLDRSMIADVAHDEKTREFVGATIALAHALGIAVTAEGVENESQARLLALAGCREVQGRFLAEPCASSDIVALLDSLRRRRTLAAIA